MTRRAAELLGVVVFFLVLALGIVILRCYVRLRIKRCFGLDDGLAVTSLVFYLVAAASMIEGVRAGSFGNRWTEMEPSVLLKGLKLLFVYESTYIVATTAIKFAVGFFLLRFCVERYQRWIIYIILVILTGLTFFIFIFVLLQCRPPSWFWQQAIDSHGTCDGSGLIMAAYVHSAITGLSDAVLGLLPICIVRSLHLPFYIKCYVSVILALGSCAAFATVARMCFVHELTDPKNLFEKTGILVWSYIEVGVAIIASSAATLRPLLDEYSCYNPRWRRLHSQHKSTETSSHQQSTCMTYEEALQHNNLGMRITPISPV
ncbi:hypothetical protein BDV25DRAFT_141860 [Aspergillus avenaceus]|uniref:Rhodopsin domain-containing protein n=1 Tax=Aspergillus avenaceus TaxID=36643 RepID=A0A5N6TPT7_ASPAV|nr:hypothetical protein BDV25DRAFT_141860 [Aspergillus avenaceus]